MNEEYYDEGESMENEVRKTHFQGSASHLFDELFWGKHLVIVPDGKLVVRDEFVCLIAKWAYDLVLHALSHYEDGVATNLEWIEDHILSIPDFSPSS